MISYLFIKKKKNQAKIPYPKKSSQVFISNLSTASIFTVNSEKDSNQKHSRSLTWSAEQPYVQ